MQTKVIIRSTNVREMHSKRTGQVFFMQSAALDNGHEFPSPFDLFIEKDKAYQPGEYLLPGDAIYVDRQGRLAVSARNLIPLAAPAGAPKKAA